MAAGGHSNMAAGGHSNMADGGHSNMAAVGNNKIIMRSPQNILVIFTLKVVEGNILTAF